MFKPSILIAFIALAFVATACDNAPTFNAVIAELDKRLLERRHQACADYELATDYPSGKSAHFWIISANCRLVAGEAPGAPAVGSNLIHRVSTSITLCSPLYSA